MGQRSDPHGTFEHHSTDGSAGEAIDPRDQPTHWTVTQHDLKVSARWTVEPAFTTPERPSKLDPFADRLSAWLKTGAGKSRKQRRTLKQLHADLVALGFTGSLWPGCRIRPSVRVSSRRRVAAYSFRCHSARRSIPFDWSEDYAVIGGERTKLQVAHIKLSHSRAFLLRPTCYRHTRCSLTPIGTAFVCLVASLVAASTIT